MARQSKKEVNAEQLQLAYDETVKKLNLKGVAINDQVKAMIIAADETLTQVCETADFIRDMPKTIREEWPELLIPPPVWAELVRLQVLKNYSTCPQKVLDKIFASYAGAKTVTAFREVAIDCLLNDKAYVVPAAEDEKQLDYSATFEMGDKFKDMLTTCAAKRHMMDTLLWPRIRQIGDAFAHLTGGTYNDFKFLLDQYHYRYGGWPSEKTPPRLWRAIAGFAYTFREINRFDLEDLLGINSWLSRFGLQVVNTGYISPTVNQFGKEIAEDALAFSQYKMYKVKDEASKKYEVAGIMPWHHLIITDNWVYVYLWDTREIQMLIKPEGFDISDLHTNYVDTCQPLWSKEPKIIEEASKELSNIFKTE